MIVWFVDADENPTTVVQECDRRSAELDDECVAVLDLTAFSRRSRNEAFVSGSSNVARAEAASTIENVAAWVEHAQSVHAESGQRLIAPIIAVAGDFAALVRGDREDLGERRLTTPQPLIKTRLDDVVRAGAVLIDTGASGDFDAGWGRNPAALYFWLHPSASKPVRLQQLDEHVWAVERTDESARLEPSTTPRQNGRRERPPDHLAVNANPNLGLATADFERLIDRTRQPDDDENGFASATEW